MIGHVSEDHQAYRKFIHKVIYPCQTNVKMCQENAHKLSYLCLRTNRLCLVAKLCASSQKTLDAEQ